MNRNVCLVIALLSICLPLLAQPFELVEERQQRRRQLLAQIRKPGVVVAFSTPMRNKNSDIDYEYRPSSNLYYLTGISQPHTVLVLLAGSASARELLFIQKRSPEQELWTGRRLSKQQARQISGVRNVYTTDTFDRFITALFSGDEKRTNQFVAGDFRRINNAIRNRKLLVYLEYTRQAWQPRRFSRAPRFDIELRRSRLSSKIRDFSPLIASLRLIKSDYEIHCLKKAVAATSEGLLRAFATAAPGVYEYQIEAEIEYCYKNNNMDWAFPSIVASGPNAAVLHYTKSQRQMERGDLLLMDVGAACRYYSADITRTIPVDGRFTTEQRQIYEIVLRAQERALEAAKVGATFYDIHFTAVEEISRGLSRLGLITDQREVSRQYQLYFMHGTCHWLGLDTHDVGGDVELEPGMVFTIEPGIYIGEGLLDRANRRFGHELVKKIAPQVRKYRNISVRIEDDIRMTADGPVVLSRNLPKSAPQVEEMMRKLNTTAGE